MLLSGKRWPKTSWQDINGKKNYSLSVVEKYNEWDRMNVSVPIVQLFDAIKTLSVVPLKWKTVQSSCQMLSVFGNWSRTSRVKMSHLSCWKIRGRISLFHIHYERISGFHTEQEGMFSILAGERITTFNEPQWWIIPHDCSCQNEKVTTSHLL